MSVLAGFVFAGLGVFGFFGFLAFDFLLSGASADGAEAVFLTRYCVSMPNYSYVESAFSNDGLNINLHLNGITMSWTYLGRRAPRGCVKSGVAAGPGSFCNRGLRCDHFLTRGTSGSTWLWLRLHM